MSRTGTMVAAAALAAAIGFGAGYFKGQGVEREKMEKVLEGAYPCVVHNPLPIAFRYWVCVHAQIRKMEVRDVQVR